jgi:hypothetical protein
MDCRGGSRGRGPYRGLLVNAPAPTCRGRDLPFQLSDLQTPIPLSRETHRPERGMSSLQEQIHFSQFSEKVTTQA